MSAKLLTEQYMEFLSLTGCCTGWSESTLVKMPHCWESHVTAHTVHESCTNISRADQYIPLVPEAASVVVDTVAVV